jgi:outer membrane lipoprotein-sorting protein
VGASYEGARSRQKVAWLGVSLGVLLFGASGCLVSRNVRVPVSPKILEAKTAGLDELLASLASYSDKIRALSSSSLKVSFTSGKVESGKLRAYRSAPGYILLKRPDCIRLNIQNPITKTALIELVSEGDGFGIWYPRENKFFSGSNSAKELELEGHPGFTARPIHIFDAILPHEITLGGPGTFVSMEEDQDTVTKYYVLSFFSTSGPQRLRILRRIWIDRSTLAISRLQTYDEDGGTAGSIRYSHLVGIEGLLLPLSIHIDRPLDGYSLDLTFTSWRLNPELPEGAFALKPPASAQLVKLKEKTRSETP